MMEGCKYAVINDGFEHPDLENMEEGNYKLNEIMGLIAFCESNSQGLIIRLEDQYEPEKTAGKKVLWNFENRIPLPAICNFALKGFYEKEANGLIEMLAYELIMPESLRINASGYVRRGKSENIKFID